LVAGETVENLIRNLNPKTMCSGGSAANTMVGISALGGKSAFIGKVKDDEIGREFAHDLNATGVKFDAPNINYGAPTASCIVLVTPDAERTMLTYLGASGKLSLEDIKKERILSSHITYIEGYLWDSHEAKKAILAASRIAKDEGRLVSFSLSDPFCVERHRTEFREIVKNRADIIFANEEEIISLYQVDKLEKALRVIKEDCQIAAITRGPLGSLVIAHGEVLSIEAGPVKSVVDTTGAGDAYAAGFLYGLTHNFKEFEAGQLASLCAAEVITKIGARPPLSLPERIKKVIEQALK
jgi:sugar/nucleoside kinase (ribokinase family)